MRFTFQVRPVGRMLVAGLVGLILVRPSTGRAQTVPAPGVGAAVAVAFTGAVFSHEGMPLPGATVTVAGPRQIPAIANAEGFFILQLPPGQPVQFVVAYPGFSSQQIELRAPEAEKNLVVTLAPLSLHAATPTRVRRGRQRP